MSRRSRTIPTTGPLFSDPVAEPARDLDAEVGAIHAWLQAHQAVSPNSISLDAGLSRNSLANLTRNNDPEKPTIGRLNKLYVAMREYGFYPHGPGLPVRLAAGAAEQLLRLASQGYVLTQASAGHWVVVHLRAPGPGPPAWIGEPVTAGPTPTEVLENAIALLTNVSGHLDAEQSMS